MIVAWAVKWVSNNRLDGRREMLLGKFCAKSRPSPEFAGCPYMLFRTRSAAREFVREQYGYISTRLDLQQEPHGWATPQVVKVEVVVSEMSQ